MQKKPNFVIVMTDQQRADLRRGAGYALDTMPFLDAWAAGGVDIARAYTSNPTCMPARVSLFTGRYSESHRVRTNHNMDDALYTKDLMDVLRENGYATALCGKNHSHRPASDFDFYEMSGHLGYEGEKNETRAQKEFADFLCATRHMESPVPSPGGIEVQHPFRNVSSALKFIDSLEGDQPFFAWVSFAEPHNPYQVPEEYFDLFPPEALPLTTGTAADLAGKGPRFVWLRHVWEQVLGPDIEARIRRARSNYHGMLRLIDDQFRRLIEGLRDRGLEEETVVLFLSDHGDFAGEYGLIRKGPDLPDLLTRIPMVWRGPGIAAQGRRAEGFASITDVLPTVCDLIGAEIPFGCQGKSLLPLLQNRPLPVGDFDSAYAESGFGGLYWGEKDALTLWDEGASSHELDRFDCLNTWTQCGQVRALWSGDWHIQIDMLGRGCLYNLAADRYELHDLWDEPGAAGVKAELLASLAAAMLRAVDPLPAPRHRYRVKTHPKGYWFQPFISADPGVRGE
ncbi:MAG: sulfatase [Candidatus Howiella sp.]|jgi:arylsulfatase A-like enzyme